MVILHYERISFGVVKLTPPQASPRQGGLGQRVTPLVLRGTQGGAPALTFSQREREFVTHSKRRRALRQSQHQRDERAAASERSMGMSSLP